mmetsp:Transcript_122006/g.390089  ORF Transcript_122006/g.390089 Transcript_122006/m.390089 type:complete len:352 (+) Transcript_122006:284-1339(+)
MPASCIFADKASMQACARVPKNSVCCPLVRLRTSSRLVTSGSLDTPHTKAEARCAGLSTGSSTCTSNFAGSMSARPVKNLKMDTNRIRCCVGRARKDRAWNDSLTANQCTRLRRSNSRHSSELLGGTKSLPVAGAWQTAAASGPRGAATSSEPSATAAVLDPEAAAGVACSIEAIAAAAAAAATAGCTVSNNEGPLWRSSSISPFLAASSPSKSSFSSSKSSFSSSLSFSSSSSSLLSSSFSSWAPFSCPSPSSSPSARVVIWSSSSFSFPPSCGSAAMSAATSICLSSALEDASPLGFESESAAPAMSTTLAELSPPSPSLKMSASASPPSSWASCASAGSPSASSGSCS